MRTEKTVNGVKHSYILDGTRLVRDEYNDVDYLYDSERKVCGMMYDENGDNRKEVFYFLKNLQGDVIAITNDGGTVLARYSYDAWGQYTIIANQRGMKLANLNLFRYRSYIYDADLGPVSYTHLDVYKRQPFALWNMKTTGPCTTG